MKLLVRLAVCAAIMALPACERAGSVTSPAPPAASDAVVGTGTILRAGDCLAWHVHADSGHWYELTRLGPEFQQGDLRVRFVLKPRVDAVSCSMMGEMTDVVSMRRF